MTRLAARLRPAGGGDAVSGSIRIVSRVLLGSTLEAAFSVRSRRILAMAIV